MQKTEKKKIERADCSLLVLGEKYCLTASPDTDGKHTSQDVCETAQGRNFENCSKCSSRKK